MSASITCEKPSENKNSTTERELICSDCGAKFKVPSDTEKGEVLSCPGCGLEMEVTRADKECVEAQELKLKDGIDWGE